MAVESNYICSLIAGFPNTSFYEPLIEKRFSVVPSRIYSTPVMGVKTNTKPLLPLKSYETHSVSDYGSVSYASEYPDIPISTSPDKHMNDEAGKHIIEKEEIVCEQRKPKQWPGMTVEVNLNIQKLALQ